MTGKTERISYQPSDGLSYDPNDPTYWEPSKLDREVTRAFEICHGCRMCFKYCDAFPTLFDLIDSHHDGDVAKLDTEERDRVIDLCFQCKLCEVQCPYTPRDGHEFQLDFPKLVHRYKAVAAERHGHHLRDRFLGDPDGTAAMARASLGLVNVLNRVKVHRWLMEKVLGVHRDKLLPDFAREPFDVWARKKGHVATAPGSEAILFQTCFVQHNDPEIGRDTLFVLARNGVDCKCVEGLECCGMPAWEHGDIDKLRKGAHHNLSLLMPHVEAGAKVLVVNPTCSMMMRREYAELVDEADRSKARAVAAAVMDPSEYLWSIRNEERFDKDVKTVPASVAYHAPCHLRAQAVGFKGRDLMRKLFEVSPSTVMECCGHDGTFAMKIEGFGASQRIGEKAFEGLRQSDAEVWSTDCPLAALQFQQHAGKKALHPMTVLARAYRGEPIYATDEGGNA